MSKQRFNMAFSEECVELLEKIKLENNLTSVTAAIEFAVSSHQGIQELQASLLENKKQTALLKKHINELRRNEYLIISMLNAMTLQLNVPTAPMHHEKKFRSPALIAAHNNLAIYLNEVMTTIKDNEQAAAGADGHE